MKNINVGTGKWEASTRIKMSDLLDGNATKISLLNLLETYFYMVHRIITGVIHIINFLRLHP